MDQLTTIQDVLDHVKSIVASQFHGVPGSISSDDGYGRAAILPTMIPALPDTAKSLPQEAVSAVDPLLHISKLLSKHVLPNLNLSSLSPRYYGFVTGGATPAALLADMLTSIYDQNNSVHLPAESIATTIEAAALNLLVDLFHLPRDQWGIGTRTGGGGTITTGATASNILGLALGREHVLNEAIKRRQLMMNGGNSQLPMSVGSDGLLQICRAADIEQIAVLSTMPHSSIVKTAGILGIGRANVISIAKAGTALDIDFDALEQRLANARRDKTVYIVTISSGEVNTARFATDGAAQMKQIRDLCDKYGSWIHVDGAFGLFGRALMNDPSLATEYNSLIQGVAGLELADSITGDGHKLLNVPYDCGFFFTRHKTLSKAVFANGTAAYLTSGTSSSSNSDDGIQNPMNIGIENSRRFRALPVYTTLMAYGRQGYIDMLRRQISLARRIVAWIYDRPDLITLPVTKTKEEALAKTFIGVLFRARDDDLNRCLVKKINATGRIYITGTSWDGQPAARIAVSNWRVDVERDSKIVQEVLLGVLTRE